MAELSAEARRFQQAALRPQATQQAYLRALWERNRDCQYFRHHGLRRVEDFRERLPLVGYADLEEWINRSARGEGKVLCSEPIRLFEPTSGTQAVKLIPYTASLKAEFGRGLSAWIGDLYGGKPELMSGKAYWSITPPPQRPSVPKGDWPSALRTTPPICQAGVKAWCVECWRCLAPQGWTRPSTSC